MTTTAIKLTPLHAVTESLGAAWVEAVGWRFPKSYASPEQEVAALRAGVGLADTSPHGKVQIEGAQAASVLTAVFGAAPEHVGAHAAVEAGSLYRLRPDLFYLATPPAGETEACRRIEAAAAAASGLVTVTDLTHGLAEMRLVGPAAVDVLARVCGLDFSDGAFPNHTAKPTSVAKSRQLVIRGDYGALRGYRIIGPRSLAAYVWSVLLEAGHAFGIAPVGVVALHKLEGQ
jgi:heterotetrameric sarcosine oxidase gamma subunit